MRFIKTLDGNFLNTDFIIFVYREGKGIFGRVTQDDECTDFWLYQGSDGDDVRDALEDIMKQITGGE